MKRLTIFTHHDKDNIIDDYVIYWLKYMNKLSDIIFVSNNNLPKIEIEKIEKYTIKYIVGEHEGRGEISLKLAYLYAYKNHILEKYDWLITVTDSIYGPFFDIEPFMIEKEKKSDIAYGFNKRRNPTGSENIIDFFMGMPKKFFLNQDFIKFIQDIKPKQNKEEAVVKGTYVVSDMLKNIGIKLEGFFNDEDPYSYKYDPTKPAFYEMIKKGYPIIRKTLFTLNIEHIENIKDYLKLKDIVPEECFNAMQKNIERVVSKEYYKINMYYPKLSKSIRDKRDIINIRYKEKYNYPLEFLEVTTFLDKLNWFKLNYHSKIIIELTDKYAVRQYVKNKVGKDILLPLLNVYNCNAEILYNLDIDQLPDKVIFASTINEQKVFLNKKDDNFDYQWATSLDMYGNKNYNLFLLPILDAYHNKYFQNLEWGYKYIIPRLLVYDNTNDIYKHKLSYKIMCFNSKPTVIKVNIKENDKKYANFYNLNWKLLPVTQEYPNTYYELKPPSYINELIEISKKLSEDFPYFIAIDFIGHENHFYFEKFDFYSDDILASLSNKEYDIKWGKLINKPAEMNEYFSLENDTYLNTLINYDHLLIKMHTYIIPQLRKEIEEKNNIIIKKDEIINNLINFINKIIWWIPIKKIRDSIRSNLLK